MDVFDEQSIAIFGDSHATRIPMPESVLIIGRGGEYVSILKDYKEQLRNFDILVIMTGGYDISSKTSFEPPKCNITQAMDHIKECFAYAEQHNRLMLTADVLTCLSNWRCSDYLNGRMEKRMKKHHNKYAKGMNLKPEDYDKSGVHLERYDRVTNILMEKIQGISQLLFNYSA